MEPNSAGLSLPVVVARPAVASAPAEIPALGVRHVLFWTAGAAVYIASMRALAGDITPRGNLLLVLLSLGQGAGLAALLALPVRYFSRRHVRQRSRTEQVSPGQWLLVVLGVETSVWIAVEMAQRHFGVRGLGALPAIATGCVLLAPTFNRRMPGVWKAVFWGLLLVTLAPLTVATLAGLLHRDLNSLRAGLSALWLRPTVGLVGLVVVAVWQWRRNVPLAGLHAAGVVAWAWVAGVSLVFSYLL